MNRIMNRLLALLIAVMLVIPAATIPGYAESSGSTDASTAVTEERIEEDLDFLYVESPELEAPGTQNIAISWDESISGADSLELVYTGPDGNKYALKEKERTSNSVLFTKEFTAEETGAYQIKGVNYTVDGTSGFFEFTDVEIKASFTVNDNVSEAPENPQILIAEQSVDNVSEDEIEDMVSDTLDAANIPEKTANTENGDIVVVLDPGHGSQEPGSSGNSLNEHELVVKIANYCKEELEKYKGVKVYLTHDGSGFSGTASERLQARVDYAKSVDADVMLSLHLNSTGSGEARGAEVWYPNENYVPEMNTVGKPLAQAVQDELTALGLKDRGIKEKSTVNDKYPDGTVQDWYGIIRLGKLAGIPTVIVEHAFIDNADDVSEYLSSNEKLHMLGKADAAGVANYFSLTTADAIDVKNMIIALSETTVTKSNLKTSKAAAEDARAAYEALSGSDKALLGADIELALVKAELNVSKVEKAVADAVLRVTKSSVGSISVSSKSVSNTSVTLKYTWKSVPDITKYKVAVYRNGKLLSTTYTTAASKTLSKYKRGYNYTIKVTPYAKYNGDTYYGKTVLKKTSVKHGTPTLTVKKSGKYRVLKSADRNSTGFQVYISTSKKFSKNLKKYKFSTKEAGLNKKLLTTKYFSKGNNYIKVRAYTTYNGETVYSSWSPVKRVYR